MAGFSGRSDIVTRRKPIVRLLLQKDTKLLWRGRGTFRKEESRSSVTFTLLNDEAKLLRKLEGRGSCIMKSYERIAFRICGSSTCLACNLISKLIALVW